MPLGRPARLPGRTTWRCAAATAPRSGASWRCRPPQLDDGGWLLAGGVHRHHRAPPGRRAAAQRGQRRRADPAAQPGGHGGAGRPAAGRAGPRAGRGGLRRPRRLPAGQLLAGPRGRRRPAGRAGRAAAARAAGRLHRGPAVRRRVRGDLLRPRRGRRAGPARPHRRRPAAHHDHRARPAGADDRLGRAGHARRPRARCAPPTCCASPRRRCTTPSGGSAAAASGWPPTAWSARRVHALELEAELRAAIAGGGAGAGLPAGGRPGRHGALGRGAGPLAAPGARADPARRTSCRWPSAAGCCASWTCGCCAPRPGRPRAGREHRRAAAVGRGQPGRAAARRRRLPGRGQRHRRGQRAGLRTGWCWSWWRPAWSRCRRTRWPRWPSWSSAGVRFAVDDFGTGYSSLARLKELPAQTVKVDRAFVTDVADDPADFAVARAVVDMARAMGRTHGGRGRGDRRAVPPAARHRRRRLPGLAVRQGAAGRRAARAAGRATGWPRRRTSCRVSNRSRPFALVGVCG